MERISKDLPTNFMNMSSNLKRLQNLNFNPIQNASFEHVKVELNSFQAVGTISS